MLKSGNKKKDNCHSLVNRLYYYALHSTPSSCRNRRFHELIKYSIRTGYGDLPPRFLLCIHNLTIVNDHSVSSGPFALGPAQSLGESCVGIGQEELTHESQLPRITDDKQKETHNVTALDLIGLAPRTHHIRVVVSQAGHNVDALLLQPGKVLDIAGKVLQGAGARERARNCKEDDFLAGELYTQTASVED